MSGVIVGRALERRFDEVRRNELDRLGRKFAGLSPSDRASVEAIIAEVIHGLVSVPIAALAAGRHNRTLEAVTHLFRLDVGPRSSATQTSGD